MRLILLLLVGLAAGLALGAPWLGLAVALGVALVLQSWSLYRVLRWLRSDDVDAAPDLGGWWSEVVALVVKLFRRKQKHKLRLLRLLRELNDSTSAMPDGVVVLTPQAEITWYNRTAGQLLGFRGKGDTGLRIDNLVRQPDFVRYLRSGDFAQPVEVRLTGAMDQFLSMQIVPYGAGQLLLLVRDVTRQVRLEAMRKDFVANASHELRSPLTVIAGYLETLAQDAALDPELAQPLAEMRRQATRMTTIVEDLLELSRLEASDAGAERALVDVGGLLTQLRKDVLARPRHPARVELSVESDNWLEGSEAEIQSAFSNLVDNAVKYTPATGAVSLRWWVDGQGGHFSVADTGAGIAAEHLPRLTERFYRVDSGRSRATGGSGLGLAIVKHVLQRHGATLTIASIEGQGSTFICNFPSERLVERPPELSAASDRA
ncbi:MAG TPA: phosphate regulon sensor histidine kinase PhoR [Steroidobacteraceae bacterium]|nr:phosphate regulon sensor histidine kinase PhoR [Steroidobacteraceae bacterium]